MFSLTKVRKPPSFILPLCLLALLAALVGQTSLALAGDGGNISGTIRDAKTGQPIAGVHLQITSKAQSATATTDGRGHFVVFDLQPDDDYSLTAEKAGYDTRTVSGYAVNADQTQEYDLDLHPTPPSPGSS